MIIALIHWRIKPDDASISEFLAFWRTIATVKDRMGLIGEFLSEPGKMADFPYITWHLDPDASGDCKHYVNVGFWQNAQAFHDQVAHLFNDDNPMKPFEKYRRRRVVLKPDSWRIGKAGLPSPPDYPSEVR